ncbi:MAG: carbohydrate ABC transporter permease [Caldilineaceae bacterium]|nr:carbohydrate ABC transporter permease [Caldilineaceae bacterium]
MEDVLVTLILLAACVIFFFPIYTIVSVSLKLPIDIMASPPRWLFQPTLQNYEALVGIRPSEFQFDLPLHFRNSLVTAGGSTLLSLVLGTPAAYAFARIRFRGDQFGLLALLAMRMLPPITTVIPLFLLMKNFRLLDTSIALILAYTTFNLPFVIWMLRSFFIDLPSELEEASWIDGASRWQAILYVILPLSAPGLVAAAIFSLMLAWNDFLFAVILTSRNASTLPVLAAGFTTEMGVSWGIMMAAGSVIVLPVLIFTLFVQRYLVAGLTSGAMKG